MTPFPLGMPDVRAIAAVAIACSVLSVHGSAQAAQSWIAKCVDGSGRVTYSDLGCGNDTRVQGRPQLTDNRIDGRQFFREDAVRDRMVDRTPPPRYAGSDDARASIDLERRRRELDMTVKSVTASREEKGAAADELGRLERGVTARLTESDARRRKDLLHDTASIDQRTRENARARLEALQDKYETREYLTRRERAREHERELEEARIQASMQAAQQAQLDAMKTAMQPRGIDLRREAAITGRRNVYYGGTLFYRANGGYRNSETGQFVRD